MFDTDKAFFLLSAPANQSSSSSSSFLGVLEISGLACFVVLSVGAVLSSGVFATDAGWLLVKDSFLSSKGEEAAFEEPAGFFVLLASSSEYSGSSSVLRPSQSAELRWRADVGVVGFGFFSGVEALTSSVENLKRLKG